MRSISLSHKRIIAFLIWACGIFIFLLFAFWNKQDSEISAEDRLIVEAGRSAAQLARVLGIAGYPLDSVSTHYIIEGAMDDENIFAVRVDNNQGMVSGLRRNYLWEPVPWDDEMVENSVQGINTLKSGGDIVGSVSVWLSPRIYQEETAQITRREFLRGSILCAIWTIAFLLVLANWGDFRRVLAFLRKQSSTCPKDNNLKAPQKNFLKRENGLALIDAENGRKYQRKNPDSFRVTAGMFRQTFARGPALINQLYSRGEYPSLCHLARMLEQAAPCIGSEALEQAASNMRSALNNPDCDQKAAQVEKCAQILQEVLEALNGKEQWRENGADSGSE